MPIIRQESLFDMQVLYDLEPTHRFNSILSGIDIHPILNVVTKKSRFGPPQTLNYAAMIYLLIVRITERIPFIKDLVKRLESDLRFKVDCGFLVSDEIPSEASYSRMITWVSESDALEIVQECTLLMAMSEGFISDEIVAIDATHVEARDCAPQKKEAVEKETKKRGRKKKEEREQWLAEKAEEEASLPLYEKKIADQLDILLSELRASVPIHPEWGVKKNSEGKNVFWFGFKIHLAVGAESQYILQSLFSSGNLNDGKAAIPLLKGIQERLASLKIAYATMDAGYDYAPIYEQVYRMGAQSVIAYNKKNEPEPIGFDRHFAPTCVREHSYRYDSFDKKHETLKYTRPSECADCPLAHDSLCQKVYKKKITDDLRKYTAPARGSLKWKQLYKARSAVERVNAYLKGYFLLNQIYHRTGKKAKLHVDLVQLAYNASKLAIDRLKVLQTIAA
ncbi:transposase [Planococcus sp. ANT_H30]|uniref:transposase n=1 Tax=Planococcus sp. ANT_H30 TaxID=2597347 RepID=UPI0011EC4361|nr:transposase [Planococcus sp. ANT_H30]KAA0956189.1 transposase [Planococcus sp. ANT_H30]